MQINELVRRTISIVEPVPPEPQLSPETIEAVRNFALVMGFAGVGATVGGFIGIILSIDYFRAGLRNGRLAQDVYRERQSGMDLIVAGFMLAGAGIGAAATAFFVYSR